MRARCSEARWARTLRAGGLAHSLAVPETTRAMLTQWDDLRMLLAVVRNGSFLAAAADLQLAVSTVSRRMGLLEQRLGAMLIERRADGARATPTGRALSELAQRIELDLAATLRDSAASPRALKGTVRLSVGDGFTQMLMDCVTAFCAQHPDVEFEFVVESRAVDLRRREADIAFRTTHKQEATLVYRRVGQLRYALWAAPDYLQRNGTPRTRDDLAGHRFVGFAPPLHRHHTMPWLRELGAQRMAVRTTSFRSLLAAIRGGAGIGALPRRAARGLVELLPGEEPPPLPLLLVSHPQALRRPEVRSFVDCVVARITRQVADP